MGKLQITNGFFYFKGLKQGVAKNHSNEIIYFQGWRIQKIGSLHDCACHPCAGGHANLLCIVPILVCVHPGVDTCKTSSEGKVIFTPLAIFLRSLAYGHHRGYKP